MTEAITHLPNGLTVVTTTMPHLETTSFGCLGVGRRPHEQAARARHFASPRAHVVQGHGDALRPGHRRERSRPVGGELNAATGLENDGLLSARVLKGDEEGRAHAVLADILHEPRPSRPTRSSASARSSCRRSPATSDSPDEMVFELLRGRSYPGQPVGRTILGTADRVQSFSGA